MTFGACLDTAPLRTVTDVVGIELAELDSDWTAMATDDLLVVLVVDLLGGFFLEVFGDFFLVLTAGDSASFDL